MAEEQAKGGRRGRPRKEPDEVAPGSAHVSARVRPEIRRAIVLEADRTGRTVSQTVEALLETALRGHAETRDLASAEGLRRMIAFARTVQDSVGDPASDRTAWAALQAGMLELARTVMPTPPLAQGDEAQFRVAFAELVRRLPALAAAIGDDALGGPYPRADRYFGPEPRYGGLTLRMMRARLHSIAQGRGDEHAAEAAELERLLALLLSLLPTTKATNAEEDGRRLARTLLGEEEPGPPLEEE